MAWNLRRTPSWPEIVLELLLGLMFVTLAVLDATRYADQVAAHGDGLMTAAMGVVGGLALGSALGSIRQRRAMRAAAALSSTASV